MERGISLDYYSQPPPPPPPEPARPNGDLKALSLPVFAQAMDQSQLFTPLE